MYMARCILAFIFMSVSLFLQAGDGKLLVLTGNAKLVDLLTAELSEEAGFRLLERAEIDKVRKEHNISQLGEAEVIKYFPHTDLFAVLSSIKKDGRELPSGIVVFNGKNGYRMLAAPLPDDEQSAVTEAGKLIRQAALKFDRKDAVLLSLKTVRGIGVSSDERYAVAQIGKVMEQILGDSPGVQVLERTYLENVITERRLTKREIALAPSSLLISLEFSSKGSALSVRLNLTDTTGKELLSRELICRKGEEVKSAKALSDILVEYLKCAPPSIPFDAAKEAERYYREFLDMGFAHPNPYPPEQLSKLYAAISLNPKHAGARMNEIKATQLVYMNDNMPWKQLYPILLSLYEMNGQYYKDFPSAYVSGDRYGFLSFARVNLSELNDAETKEAIAFCNKIRPLYREDMKRYGGDFKHDLSDGINDPREWQRYGNWSREGWSLFLYDDPQTWMNERFDQALNLLRITNEYVEKNPEFSDRMNDIYAVYYARMIPILNPTYPVYCGLASYRTQMRSVLKRYREYAALAKQSRILSPRVVALELETMGKLMDAGENENSLRAVLKDFFTQLDKLAPDAIVSTLTGLNGSDFPLKDPQTNNMKATPLKNNSVDASYDVSKLSYFIRDSIGYRFSELPQEEFSKYAKNNGKMDLNVVLKLLASGGSVGQADIIKLVPEFQKNYLNLLASRESRKNLVFIGDLKKNFLNDMLPALNPEFDIKTFSLSPMDGISWRYKGAVRGKDGNHFFCLRSEEGKYEIFGCVEIHIAPQTLNVSIEKLPQPPVKALDTHAGGLFSAQGFIFTGDYLILQAWDSPWVVVNHDYRNSGKRIIAVFDCNLRKWSLLDGMPDEPLNAAYQKDGKLYLLFSAGFLSCGMWGIVAPGGPHLMHSTLISCAVDGSERQVIFSTRRNKPENPLDRLTGNNNLDGLIPMDDNGDEFVFLSGRPPILFTFNVKTGEYKEIAKFPYLTYRMWMRDFGDSVCFTIGANYEKVYRLDKKTRKLELLLAMQLQDDAGAVYRVRSEIGLKPPYAFPGNTAIWSCGFAALRLNMESPEKSPFFLLAVPFDVYSLPCGTVVYFVSDRLCFIREKATPKKIK